MRNEPGDQGIAGLGLRRRGMSDPHFVSYAWNVGIA
jgi:hypothetical protein